MAVDLHDMGLTEAVKDIKARLREIKNGEHDCKEVDEFVVITGKGLHSRGEPVIKPAIEGIFAARKFVFKEVEGNSGRLVVGFEVIKAKI